MAETKAKQEVKEVVKYIEVEKKAARPDKFDVWGSAPKSEWRYVTIPKTGLHGFTYPDIAINHDRFSVGEEYARAAQLSNFSLVKEDTEGRTFFVPPILADEIERIMKRHHVEEVALLQPKRRLEALRQLAGSPGSTKVVAASPVGGRAQQEGIPGTATPNF